MALLHIEGFEGVPATSSNAQVQTELITRGMSAATTNNFSINATSPRTGARCLNGTTSFSFTYTSTVADRHARFATGLAFSPTPSAGNVTVTIRDSGGTNVAVVAFTAAGTITTTVLGTLRATTTFAGAGLAAGAYNYLEVEAFANATTGAIRVYVNDVLVPALSFDGNTGSTVLGSILYNGAQCFLDDLYVVNGAGGAPWNTRLGDVAVGAAYPSGAGSSTQFAVTGAASNWQAVSETSRSVAEFVASSTVGHRDLYALGDAPTNATAILGLRVLGYAQKSDAGSRTAALPVRSGGTTSSGTASGLSTSWAYLVRLLQANPITGTQWTVSELNGLEAGVEVAS
jgi:hypothetical protein